MEIEHRDLKCWTFWEHDGILKTKKRGYFLVNKCNRVTLLSIIEVVIKTAYTIYSNK